MVNPPKTAVQVNAESLEGKQLYKVSHHDFDVGRFNIDGYTVNSRVDAPLIFSRATD